MCQVNDGCEHWSEDGKVQVLADEDGVVGEERRIERQLNASYIETAVFGEGVIAVDEEGNESENKEEQMPGGGFPGC